MCGFRSVNPNKTAADIEAEYNGIHPDLKKIVEELSARYSVTITGGKTNSGHSPSGYHPVGMAVDFVIDAPYCEADRVCCLYSVLTIAGDRIGGIGIMNGCYGFHIDTRQQKTFWGYGPHGEGLMKFTPQLLRPMLEQWAAVPRGK